MSPDWYVWHWELRVLNFLLVAELGRIMEIDLDISRWYTVSWIIYNAQTNVIVCETNPARDTLVDSPVEKIDLGFTTYLAFS